MTIDKRREYNMLCIKNGLFEQADFRARYRSGSEIKRALKHYWQLVDKSHALENGENHAG